MAEQAFDLDAPTPRRTPRKAQLDAEYDIPDDLVAAARRAAQAAAAKAEERGSGPRIRRLPRDAETPMASEIPTRRKRSFLIICAAVLLAISAALLYSRLWSKPEANPRSRRPPSSKACPPRRRRATARQRLEPATARPPLSSPSLRPRQRPAPPSLIGNPR